MIVADARVSEFVSAQINTLIFPPFTCAGIERDGRIIAGAVFNCFTGADIEATIAGHGWTRGFIRAVGQYVYGQLGCVRMQVSTEQELVARFAERLGGKREGIMRDKFGKGRDGILIGILADEYGLVDHKAKPH